MNPIRETLFGDMPMELWPKGSDDAYPWREFIQARDAVAAGDAQAAVEIWKRIAADSTLEARHTLQAWHFLRGQGEPVPEDEAKRLLGVVVEVAMPEGTDLLAAYSDCSARYYNYTGSGVVWERPDASLDAAVNLLLEAAREVVVRIGPWDRERPGVPPAGQVRLNFLVPSGLHFGQGDFQVLASDPMGGPIITAATRLMQALIEKRQSIEAQ